MRENVLLAPFTTLGIGGPARWYLLAEDEPTVRRSVSWALERGVPWMILGGGSNVLISDEGFPGLVIHLASRGTTETPRGLRVAAGEDWDAFVARCVSAGLAGMECLSGIPGRVGATPIQNVGAYGQEVKDVIESVETLDTHADALTTFSNEECAFAYRDSRFKSREPGRYVVLAVTYRLTPGGPPTIRYPELARAVGENPSLQHVRDTVIAIRRKKSMVLDPQDPDSRSVGSFFMNPIVPAGTPLPDDCPRYPAGPDRIKLSAAWLIEHAGFPKGYTSNGRAALSRNHTLAIVNRDHATAADVLTLKSRIQAEVLNRFNIPLHPEPVFIHL